MGLCLEWLEIVSDFDGKSSAMRNEKKLRLK
jgi:hypothetical protein